MFKVGDIVIGTEESNFHYGVTNSLCVCVVKSIRDKYTMDVCAIEYVGEHGFKINDDARYAVNQTYFELYGKSSYELELL